MNYNFIISKFLLLEKKNQLKKKFLSLHQMLKSLLEHNLSQRKKMNIITIRKISKISKKHEVIFLLNKVPINQKKSLKRKKVD
jgi:hypothetical protein